MSLNIQRFVCNPLQENCYIVSDDTKEAVIIDCGAFYEEERKAVVKYIKDNHFIPRHLIATHGHVDHNFGNDTIQDAFGLYVEVHSNDEPLITTLAQQAYSFANIIIDNDKYRVGKYLIDGDTITFGAHTFTIIPTPGHTPGSVFFYCKEENVAFSGDTLFRMSIGRTDFALGSYPDIIDSLRRIVNRLPSDTVILPGHGPQTTMADEKATNPYLRF